MVKVENVIKTIEKLAPAELAESWDNSGWQINLGKKSAKNVLLCLSVTPDILSQAVNNGCDLIISHHPLFFTEFKKISPDSITQKLLVEAVKNGIQIYSAHTNLDKAKGGVNDILCEKLGLSPKKTICDYVKISNLSEEVDLDDFIIRLKLSLNVSKIKIINPDNIQKIRRIAVCSGSGGDFASELSGVDAFITGDIKYHTALDVQNMVLIDAGHFETERIILETIKNLIKKEAPDAVIAKEKEPWIVV